MARRWLIVGAGAVALAAVPVAVSAVPAKTPATGVAALAAHIRASAVRPFQGYAVSTGSAGLPAIPQLGDVADLLNGDTRMRVWYRSSSHWRVDVLGVGAERGTYQAEALRPRFRGRDVRCIRIGDGKARACSASDHARDEHQGQRRREPQQKKMQSQPEQ